MEDSYTIELPSGATLEVFRDAGWWAGIVTRDGWQDGTIWRDTAQEVEDAAIVKDSWR